MFMGWPVPSDDSHDGCPSPRCGATETPHPAYVPPNANAAMALSAEVGGTFRVLDLTEASVRSAIDAASSTKALYESDAATDYMKWTA
jgi:hypothetical protein